MVGNGIGNTMPHCIIEHSSNLDPFALNELVFTAAHESKLFSEDGSDIKVRSQGFNHYLVGGVKQDFIHVSIRLLASRSADRKRMLSLHTQSKLKRLNLERASITVEVIDMDSQSYVKG